MNQPHQPAQLVAPELNYPYICGLSLYESAMLKSLIVLVVDVAINRMKGDE